VGDIEFGERVLKTADASKTNYRITSFIMPASI
jgi:hypothetical protein